MLQLFLSKAMEAFQRMHGLRTGGWKIRNPVWIDIPKNLSVGKGTWAGPFVYITMQNPSGYMKVGEKCELNPFCAFLCGGGIELGRHVLVSPGVKIISSTNNHLPGWEIWKNQPRSGKVVIEDNVHIGSNAVILPNVRIGEGSVIGAGAVVTKNIPAGSIAVGIPARVIQKRKRQ